MSGGRRVRRWCHRVRDSRQGGSLSPGRSWVGSRLYSCVVEVDEEGDEDDEGDEGDEAGGGGRRWRSSSKRERVCLIRCISWLISWSGLPTAAVSEVEWEREEQGTASVRRLLDCEPPLSLLSESRPVSANEGIEMETGNDLD